MSGPKPRPGRPSLFVNATVHTLDPLLGDLTGVDVLVAGTRIVAAGPGPHTAGTDDVVVVDCTGLAVVPMLSPSDASLAPGTPATFAVVPAAHGDVFERVLWWPSQATAIVVDGEFGALTEAPPAPPSSSPHLGMWIDTTGFIHQQLTADGRYDETRGGRRHAYQGSFRIDGDRIVYRDDLGFWAYGRFTDGVLHHAGYTFQRHP